MFSPSIYIYLLFLPVFIKLIVDGYWKNMFRGLFYWLKDNFSYTLLTILITILVIFFLDKPTYIIFNNFSHPLLTKIANFSHEFGKGEVHFSLILVIILLSSFFHKDKLSKIFSQSLMAAVFAGILVNILKIIFTRARPFVAANPYLLFAFQKALAEGEWAQYPYLSMPSGHTITIFAAIVPLYCYFKNIYFRIFLLLLGLVVAFGRVYLGVHWLSDVFLGALLGILIGKIMYQNNIGSLRG